MRPPHETGGKSNAACNATNGVDLPDFSLTRAINKNING
jgi:hypothetical protein